MKLTKQQEQEIVEEFIAKMDSDQADKFVSEIVGAYFDPHTLFDKTIKVLEDSKKGLRSC
jgi:hypothetical protein